MKILYSFNKQGYEAECWERGINAASDDNCTFIPFNHQCYLNPRKYIDAVKLDVLYREKNRNLLQMYKDFEAAVSENQADAVIVNNCPPYHPDFLKKLNVYKVLFSGDDPGATYMRNIPYLHAYDHVFYLDPDYSEDMNMSEKMRYCGMINENWIPHGVFDEDYDTTKSQETVLGHERDIDIIYVGAPYIQKLGLMAKIKKKFKNRCHYYGRFRFIWNLYYNVRYLWPGWMQKISFPKRVQLHQRAKIGFNIHWNNFGLGNQRLYYLPANGVMQICDQQKYLNKIYEVGKEIEVYRDYYDLIEKIEYYLAHDAEREAIALNGFNRTMKHYRFSDILKNSVRYIANGMK